MAIKKPVFGNSQGRRTVIKSVGVDVALSDNGASTVMIDRLADLALRMQDLQPVLDFFGRYLVERHIPAQFRAHGTPARWAALSPRYAAWKQEHFPGKPILVRTGAMRDGFSWEATARSMRIINRVRAGQSSGSKPRWTYHQTGTRKMPARPMLQFTDKDYQRLRDLARQHLAVEGGIE